MKLANLDPVSSAPKIDREREVANKELAEQYGKVVSIDTLMEDTLPDERDDIAEDTASGLLRFADFLKKNKKVVQTNKLKFNLTKSVQAIKAYTYLDRKIEYNDRVGLHIKKKI